MCIFRNRTLRLLLTMPLIVASVGAFPECSPTARPKVTGMTGTLTIKLASRMLKPVLAPPLDTFVSDARISGRGPGGAVFNRRAAGPQVEIDNLEPGAWNVTVEAFNPGRDLIGRSDQRVEVSAGRAKAVDVDLTPEAGAGSADDFGELAAQQAFGAIRQRNACPSGWK